MTHNVLETIIRQKQAEVAAAQRQRPVEALREEVAASPPVREFCGSLAACRRAEGIALIAEVKKASPSAGVIRADFDPVAIARTYEQHGAACLSVLTDEPFFSGSLSDLEAVRDAVSLPLLRKDFILETYQVWEARAAGADCVLLIAECLDDRQLHTLYNLTRELGMEALIELYEAENLDRVLPLQPPLLGINNRDLKTFTTRLEHTLRLADHVPEATLLVSESGIQDRADVLRLQEAGVGAVLVGETLMRAADIGAKLNELLGKDHAGEPQ